MFASSSTKIVFLIPEFARGGTQRQVYLLAREFKQRHGSNVEVWALFSSGEYAKEFEAAGVPTKVLGFLRPQCPVRIVRTWYWARRLLQIAKQFRAAGVDVLLPFTSWPNVIAGLTYRLGGVRLCIWGERSSGVDRVRMERLALRQYRTFIANSTAGVDFLSGEMGVSRSLISYVPNAVEEPKAGNSIDWRNRLGLAPGQLLVLKVANIMRFRDHATLLHAWKHLQDAWQGEPKPVLALAGAFGDSFRDVQRIWREGRLDSTVRFMGAVQDVGALIDASDLAVFTSRKEGMPNAILECMAGGKAVIATDLPGIRDALGPNAGDVLVPAGDPVQLARRLLDLLPDASRRTSLGDRNRKYALSEFTVARMANTYLDVMERQSQSLRFAKHQKAAQTADEPRSHSA